MHSQALEPAPRKQADLQAPLVGRTASADECTDSGAHSNAHNPLVVYVFVDRP